MNAAVSAFQIGNTGSGFSDHIPRQIVRTNDDRLYVFASQQYTKSMNVYWTTSPGLPSSSSAFNGSLQVSDSANIISVDAVYDGVNIIHVLVNTQSGVVKDYPFDKTTNTFRPAKTIATGAPVISGDYIGTVGVSGLFDAFNTLHIAYWSAGRRITYQAFTYNVNQDSLTTTSGPTQIDSNGSANHPALAVSPSDNSVTIAWVSEATNPARILARTKQPGSNWGSIENVSTAPVWTSTAAGINIDQGPYIVIDNSGVKHLTYIETYDSTGQYGRIHYATSTGGTWSDQALNAYTNNPAVALNSLGEVYILGHGYANNSGACASEANFCMMKKSGNTWGSFQLVAQAGQNQTFDSSASVKWSVIGWNRPDVIEFVFFNPYQGSTNSTLMYGRITSSVTLTPTTTVVPTISNTSTPTPTSGCTLGTKGDANCDGKVDGIDYIIWLTNYNTTTSQRYSKGDFNNDGKVDGIDYIVWLTNYGK